MQFQMLHIYLKYIKIYVKKLNLNVETSGLEKKLIVFIIKISILLSSMKLKKLNSIK